MTKTNDKIILYTNHGCPWAHRAHIALNELGLDFEEVIIDLTIPRAERTEYLKINPRGLVPTLSWNGEIIPESGIVAQFLADAYPTSGLVKPSNTPDGALQRAKYTVFVDAFFSKFQAELFKFWSVKTDAEALPVFEAAVAVLALEIEPRLEHLTEEKPYFGGSEKLTLVEVLTGSFLVRLVASLRAGIYPASFQTQLAEKTPRFWKWAQLVSVHPSVTSIFDEEKIVGYTKARLEKARASA
ncbi:thioredoxin-like protein [Obelidium mucronatum]|nr:thioredoxin-like protein [Obelidium mucronatum]